MKLTDIKPGCVIEWTQVIDRYRGYVKDHRHTVVSRQGRNIEVEDGNWLWWPSISEWHPTIAA